MLTSASMAVSAARPATARYVSTPVAPPAPCPLYVACRRLHPRRAISSAATVSPATPLPRPHSPTLSSPYGHRSIRCFSAASSVRTAEAKKISAHPGSFVGLGTTSLSNEILLRCTVLDANGSVQVVSGTFKKSDLCSEHGLEHRDLRKIDSRVPNLVPTVLARRCGFLVNILHIRALVKADAVLLFDSYGSTDTHLHSAFLYNLQHNLKFTSSPLPYEFRALESILASVLDALRSELFMLRGLVASLLEALDQDIDREKLRLLLQYSRKLSGFLGRVRGVKAAVTEILDDEQDMALMYLSEASKGTPRLDNMHEELELLLESCDKQVEEVLQEADSMASNITSTQEIVELILDSNRNQLLAMDLKMSITTLGVSTGTLWVGFFGMNLTSGLEQADGAFLTSSGVALGLVAVVAIVGLRSLQRLRRVGLGLGYGRSRGERASMWLGRWRRQAAVASPYVPQEVPQWWNPSRADALPREAWPTAPHFDDDANSPTGAKQSTTSVSASGRSKAATAAAATATASASAAAKAGAGAAGLGSKFSKSKQWRPFTGPDA